MFKGLHKIRNTSFYCFPNLYENFIFFILKLILENSTRLNILFRNNKDTMYSLNQKTFKTLGLAKP